MKRNGRFAAAAARFMQGRYGMDQYTRFLSWLSVGLMLLSLLIRFIGSESAGSVLFYLAFAALVWSYFRMLSRNFEKRQAENTRYMAAEYKVRAFFRFQRERFQQRREYTFFRCPGCKETMRVPRGKGRIRITCRRCGYTFEKKT